MLYMYAKKKRIIRLKKIKVKFKTIKYIKRGNTDFRGRNRHK